MSTRCTEQETRAALSDSASDFQSPSPHQASSPDTEAVYHFVVYHHPAPSTPSDGAPGLLWLCGFWIPTVEEGIARGKGTTREEAQCVGKFGETLEHRFALR